jgi:hypothetical protein
MSKRAGVVFLNSKIHVVHLPLNAALNTGRNIHWPCFLAAFHLFGCSARTVPGVLRCTDVLGQNKEKEGCYCSFLEHPKDLFLPLSVVAGGAHKCGVDEIMWALEAIVDAEEKWCEHMPLVTVLIWWHTGF